MMRRPVRGLAPARVEELAMQLHTYLFLSGGRCREAFERYAEVLGGELEAMSYADMPPSEDAPVAEDQRHLFMHAAVTMPDGALLMGSDDPSGDGGPMTGFAVSVTVGSVEEAERIFGALADGGEVTMPMAEQFWAPRFGMCTDRFGVPWMVSAEA
jgi:PhnB protein